jgi:hypothetical protein
MAAGTQAQPNRLWMALASMAIVIVLALQSLAVARGHHMGWPFTDYPMYSQSHKEGERVQARRYVYATLADGSEVPLTPEDLGLGHFWLFTLWVEAPLLKQERAELEFVREAYREQRGGEIVALRIEDHPVIVTREGAKAAPPPHVLATVRFASPEGDG